MISIRRSPTSIRAIVLALVLALVNVLVWLVAWGASARFPFLIAAGWLAYAFGLRHAVDADHIAAIDNTTRKLMRDGKRPLGVGFFFSLGHSTVVFLLAVLLNFGIRGLDHQLGHPNSALQHTTQVVGTSISGFFLFLIAGL